MRVDLHNHTSLCNHASGTCEEFVLKAIEEKIDIFGFSDHAPMPYDPKYRMTLDKKEDYEKEILFLKNKYKNQIDILLAYEVDYMQNHKLILDSILNSNVDYLIGSVHFLGKKTSDLWGFDKPEFISKYQEKNIDKIWQDYFDTIEQMAKLNVFDVVGHIDLIKVFKFLPKKDIRLIAKNALKAIKKSNMVLEINSAGLRKPIKETYPSIPILEEAYDLNIDITFSSDAHEVSHIGFSYDKCLEIAKNIGFTKCISFKNKEKITHNL